ncbi:MAG: Fic/DOC family N-terminal domain-containing protein [Acidimicrobiia bacterium]
MQVLKESPIGATVVITGHDHRFGVDYEVDAYIPDPLPREVELSDVAWGEISDAMAELGRLDAAAAHVPNPSLLIRVTTRLEAVGTSALEGTYADLTEVFAAETSPGDDEIDELPSRIREVVNFVRTAELAYSWIGDTPLTKGLISTLQGELVKGTDSDGPQAGDMRTTQVFIGPRDRPITEARFIPSPAGDQLESAYDQWFDWIREDMNPPDLQVLVHTALAHYQFETIHPYHDGNGRVGRLVAVLQLMRRKALGLPVLSISPWLEERKDDYRDHLFNVSASGKWEPWVRFFVEAVSAESKRSRDRIDRLLGLQGEFSARVRARVPRGRLAVDVVDNMIAFPVVTVADVERRYSTSNQAARNAVHRLVDEGFLEPLDDLAYGQRFWSPRVFQVIGEP